MAKRKKLRLAKWEQTTKAISVSLTIMQLGNMSIPMVTNYAHAAEVLTEHEQSEGTSNANTVSDSVYAMPMAVSETNAPTITFDYSAYSGGWLRFSESVRLNTGRLEVRDETDQSRVISHIEVHDGTPIYADAYMEGGYFLADSNLRQLLIPNLQDGHTYSLHISSGMFKNLSGHETKSTEWNFKIANAQEPHIVWRLPRGKELESTSTALTLAFNKPIQLGEDGEILIYRSENDAIYNRITIKDGRVKGAMYKLENSPIPNELSFYSYHPLEENTEYYVTATSGAIVDMDGRGVRDLLTPRSWTFRTLDDISPTVIFDYSVASGYLRLNFNEPIKLANGYLKIYDQETGQEVASINASNNEFFSGQNMDNSILEQTSARFHVQGLKEGHNYKVLVSYAMFSDTSNNVYPGTGEEGWVFHTTSLDRTAPKMTFDYSNYSGGWLNFDEAVEMKTGILEVWDETNGAKVTTHINAISGRIVNSNAELRALSGQTDWHGRGSRLYQLTIPNLQEDHTYSVHISSGMFADLSGNLYGGTSDSHWSFHVEDIRQPGVVALSPTRWGTPTQPTLAITFNKKMKLGQQGEVQIYRSGDDKPQERLIIHDGQLSGASYTWLSGTMTGAPSGTFTVQMTPQHQLDENKDYYVRVTSGAFVDRLGTGMNDLMYSHIWNFRTLDRTAPKLNFDYSNYSGSWLKFNEAVELKTGTLEVWDETNQSKVLTHIEAVSGRIVASNATLHGMSGSMRWDRQASTIYQLTIPNLQEDHTYSVHISSGMFADLSGNAYGGTSDSHWSFHVEDIRQPGVVALSPTRWGTPTQPTLAITFNKKMKLGQQGEVQIYRSGDDKPQERLIIHDGQLSGASYTWLSGTMTGAPSGTFTVQMTPQHQLDENKDYYVRVTSGAFVDRLGTGMNDLMYSHIWNFRTLDRTAPKLNFDYSNYSGSWLKFNEAVELKTGTLEVWDETNQSKVLTHIEAVSGRIVASNATLHGMSGSMRWDRQASTIYQLTIPNLQEDHTYSVHISSGMFADLSGNAYGGTSDSHWSFHVEDIRQPGVVALSPTRWGTPTQPTLAITFNKKMKLGQQGEVQIYRSGDDKPQERLIIHDGQLSGASYTWLSGTMTGAPSGTFTVQMTPQHQLDENKDYYVRVTSGAFVDRLGTGMNDLMYSHIWNFRTLDRTAPKLNFDYSNYSGSWLKFNEAVELKTGTLEVWDETNQSKVLTHIEAVSGRIVASNATLHGMSGSMRWDRQASTIYQLTIPNLQEDHTYSVHISSGMFADLSGNWFGGTPQAGWSFKVVDTRTPSIVDHSPVIWGTPMQPTIALSFNKKMKLGQTGEVRIYRLGEQKPQERLIVHNGQLSGASYIWTSGLLTGPMSGASTIQMTPQHELDQDTIYYVTVTSGAFVDNLGKPVKDVTNLYDWTFRTHDRTAPTLTFDYSNYSGSWLKFNEAVELKTGTLEVWDETNQSKVLTHIEAVSGRIVASNATLHGMSGSMRWDRQASTIYQLTIPNLQEDHTYSVHISSGMFADLSGNAYGGTSDSHWSFHVEDIRQPGVVALSPTRWGTPTQPTLAITFNKKMKLGQQGEVQIYRSGDDKPQERLIIHDGQLSGASYTWLSGTMTGAPSGTFTVQMTPQHQLDENKDYYVRVTSGAFVDRLGTGMNDLMYSHIWNFRTLDRTAPKLNFDYSNYSGSWLKFNEAVELKTGTLEVWDETNQSKVLTHIEAVSGRIVASNATLHGMSGSMRWDRQASTIYQLTIPNLQEDHTYSVHISSGMFADLSGNAYGGTRGADWNFHVTDTGRMSHVWMWAGNNRAPIRPPIQFRFDKQMKLGQQGEIQIYEKDSSALAQRLIIHDGKLSGASFSWLSPEEVATVSGTSSIVEVIPQRDLKYDSDYYVTFSSGAFVDSVGRGTAGLSRPKLPYTLFRTIFDMVPPTMTFDYSNYSGGFLRFSEGVQLNKGTLEVWDETNQAKVVTHIEASSGTIVVGNANLDGISGRLDAGMGMDLYHLSIPNLQDGHTYSVHISSGMFVDVNGNRYEGTPEAGWSFKTVQSTKPDDNKKTSTTSPSTGGGGGTGGSSTPLTTTPQPDSNTGISAGSNPPASNTGNDKTTPPASNASMLTTPQIASSGTVSLPAPVAPTANTFVHYYDAKWDKWIAVPTTSDGTTMKADVPAGSWTSVIHSDQAVKPADVVKSWAVAPVMKLMSLGIVQGDTQGNYNPKQAINRYEMAVILAKTLRLDTSTPTQGSPASSVNAPDWAQPYVQAIVSQGIMTGNSDSFNGNGQVTREQLATLIGRMLPDSAATSTPATNVTFKDASKMSTWAVQGIAKVQALGLMKGYDDQNFRPKQAVTREEMAAVIAKVVDML